MYNDRSVYSLLIATEQLSYPWKTYKCAADTGVVLIEMVLSEPYWEKFIRDIRGRCIEMEQKRTDTG
jgi:2-keto-3-deoxy-6-phosphogluconate aldolase